MVVRLIYIPTTQSPKIVLRKTPEQTTKQGHPVVILEMCDYMYTLTVYYKYTFVGNFSTTMSEVYLITKIFIEQTQLSGGFHCTL